MRSKLIIVLLLISGILGLNERKNQQNKVEPTLSLITTNYYIRSGETATIEPILEGTNEDLEILYQSADESIVTVEDGLITGLKQGKTIVVVYLKEYPHIKSLAYVFVQMNDQQIADLILKWVKQDIGSVLLKPKFFPRTHPNFKCTITYESSNLEVLDNRGLFFAKDYDEEVNLTINVNYNNKEAQEVVKLIIGGKIPQEIANEFLNQFSLMIIQDHNINTNLENYPNAEVSWRSSNPEIFSNEGIYNQPFSDEVITIYALVVLKDQGFAREYSKQVTVKGMSSQAKIDVVKNWVLNQMNINFLVNVNLELPIRYENYDTELSWTSNKPEVLSSTGAVTIPKTNEIVNLTCAIKFDNETLRFTLELEVVGKEYSDKWEAVDVLLGMIFKDEIKTQKITFTGVGPAYQGYNNGYLPFYVNSPSAIIDDFITGVNRPGSMYEKKWITIHDTANNNEGANAEMHNRYIKNITDASWHYTIDDQNIYHHIPDAETAWHAATTEGNRHGIGIETCINLGVDYNTVMRKTAKLAGELMMEYDLTMYSIRQHNYFSGKNCPQVIRGSYRWDEMLELVLIEYFAHKHLQGVDFIWESLSPEILDNQGKVYNHPGYETEVSYKVKVTYNGITKEFTHTSKLMSASWIN